MKGSIDPDTDQQVAADRVVRPYEFVLLAGALHPSPLRRELDIPALCLPLSRSQTLLDVWLQAIARTPGCDGIHIVVSSPADAERLSRQLNAHENNPDSNCADTRAGDELDLPDIRVTVDPNDWRGPAGLLHDLAAAANLAAPTVLVAAEAACLPPPSLSSFLDAFADGDHGLVLGGRSNEPAGIYAFSPDAISVVPEIGYFDLREQLLPHLYERGMAARLADPVDEITRLRTREDYLLAVRRMLERLGDPVGCSADATISPSARIVWSCLIRDGAVIEDGAVVHQSIILDGARIGGGAVVSESVIGPGVTVKPREMIRRRVVQVAASQGRFRAPTITGTPNGDGQSRRQTSAGSRGGILGLRGGLGAFFGQTDANRGRPPASREHVK